MKITVEHVCQGENEVILRCRELDEEMLGVLSLPLAELEDRWGDLGLFRCGKSWAVNLHEIRKLKSCPAGKIEALLSTGEKLLISRHYALMLRERLGM